MHKINYNIALIGFGGVNRALVNIISINPEKFYREMGLIYVLLQFQIYF